jgi:hypothetical protein
MKLDVGCGHRPEGDVNVDLFIGATPHRSSNQYETDDYSLNADNIPNLVCADACHLPFQNNIFNECYSSHTIEHVRNPLEMLKEMVRVSNNMVMIRCPHRFASHKKKKLHINSFNITWFLNAFKKLGIEKVEGSYSDYKHFPHVLIPLVRIPVEIQVRAWKGSI